MSIFYECEMDYRSEFINLYFVNKYKPAIKLNILACIKDKENIKSVLIQNFEFGKAVNKLCSDCEYYNVGNSYGWEATR